MGRDDLIFDLSTEREREGGLEKSTILLHYQAPIFMIFCKFKKVTVIILIDNISIEKILLV